MTSEPRYENIPQELKERRQWVCYRIEERDGKPTKIPYRTGKAGRGKARTNDPATWHAFEEVVKAVGKPKNGFEGIGFVLSETDPYVFIDLDHVVDGGGIEGWAAEIIDRVGSYAEFSRSGTGIHVMARAKKPGPRCRTHKHPQFEIYDNVRLVACTGKLVPGSSGEIRDAQSAVDQIYFSVFGENTHNAPLKEPSRNARPVGMSDPALIEKAVSAANGDKFGRLWNGNTADYNGDDSAADLALCCMLAFWTQKEPDRMDRLFRESGLMRDKWDQKRGERTYGEMTIEAAIRQTAEVWDEPAQGRTPDTEEEDFAPHALLTHGELVAGEMPPVEWLVEGLIPQDGITIIGGDAGVGKSWLVCHLAQCVAGGFPYLGHFPVKQGAVLVVDPESGPNLLKRRVKKLFRGLRRLHPDAHDALPLRVLPMAIKFEGRAVDSLIVYLKREGTALVIIDPLIHLHRADENSSGEMAALFETVRRIQKETGCCFVLTHHSRKENRLASSAAGQMLRGSSAIRGILDSHIFCWKLKTGRILVEHDKSRHAEPVPSFLVEIVDEDEETTVVRYGGEAEEPADKAERALDVIKRILADAGGTASRKVILQQAEGERIPHRTAERALAIGVKRGELRRERKRREAWYQLLDSAASSEGTAGKSPPRHPPS